MSALSEALEAARGELGSKAVQLDLTSATLGEVRRHALNAFRLPGATQVAVAKSCRQGLSCNWLQRQSGAQAGPWQGAVGRGRAAPSMQLQQLQRHPMGHGSLAFSWAAQLAWQPGAERPGAECRPHRPAPARRPSQPQVLSAAREASAELTACQHRVEGLERDLAEAVAAREATLAAASEAQAQGDEAAALRQQLAEAEEAQRKVRRRPLPLLTSPALPGGRLPFCRCWDGPEPLRAAPPTRRKC